jgi:hypothetical protein
LLAAIIFLLGFAAALIARRWFIIRTPLADGQSRDAEVLRRLRYAGEGGRLPDRESGLFDMLAKLDQTVPQWIGRWVMDNRLVLRASADIVLLLGGAVLVAVASLAQGKAAPASIAGAVGGHVAFVATLRGHPLASVVLRVSPLQFAVALAGVVRLPLAISLMYFAPLALIALAADPAHWSLIVACALALLTANGMYALLLANVPLFPGLASTIHAVALMLLLQGAFQINAWIALPIAAYLVLSWRSARRRYRVYA